MLPSKWVQKLRNSPLPSSRGSKSALRSFAFHPEDRHSKFIRIFGTHLARNMESHVIIVGVTATRNWNTPSESPQREAQILLQSHCNEKLKSYFRFAVTRNANLTSESLQRGIQILSQRHSHEKLKSHFRVTATRNSNPYSESQPRETQNPPQSHRHEKLKSYFRVMATRNWNLISSLFCKISRGLINHNNTSAVTCVYCATCFGIG